MMAFTNIALHLGCVVIAADGPAGKPPNDNPPWRWAMISSLLDHVHQSWPKSRRWPIVSAGYSGGGKWAGVMGAILAQKNYNLIGVFMAAVNQDMASEAAKVYEPAVRFKKVPIYISSGTDDKLATPLQHEEVKESLLSNGFTTVRLESFKGGHSVSDDELRKGLKWFFEEYNKE
jgi:predicted esterase